MTEMTVPVLSLDLRDLVHFSLSWTPAMKKLGLAPWSRRDTIRQIQVLSVGPAKAQDMGKNLSKLKKPTANSPAVCTHE